MSEFVDIPIQRCMPYIFGHLYKVRPNVSCDRLFTSGVLCATNPTECAENGIMPEDILKVARRVWQFGVLRPGGLLSIFDQNGGTHHRDRDRQ